MLSHTDTYTHIDTYKPTHIVLPCVSMWVCVCYFFASRRVRIREFEFFLNSLPRQTALLLQLTGMYLVGTNNLTWARKTKIWHTNPKRVDFVQAPIGLLACRIERPPVEEYNEESIVCLFDDSPLFEGKCLQNAK